MYPNDSYNWAGCLGNTSPLFSKITPQSLSVYLPNISELKKFPILTKAPPNAVGIVSLSKIHRRLLKLYFLLNINRPIVMPIAAPWLARPLKPVNL